MNHQVGPLSERADEIKSLAENYARWLCKFQIEGGADRKAEAAASARQQLYSAIDALASKQPAAAPICSACGHPLPPGGCSPGERCNAGEQPAAASEREGS